ncbi:hypothetical protein B0T10DRAFT_474482 [Thelonectria olida]|uniref:Uncharacterized protein n=1 Tax=Thelonectria olida TaxID=1576542 RepID=A0A9P9AVP6_9HYPO|nr:hypothetical protein B0T10DRAFT_474482 [Thelonectria olida]
MAGVQQPYMYAYSAVERNDSRFPETTFDPKAVTRASWQPKPPRPKSDGPLITFNRHPDAHMVLSHRSNNYSSLSPRFKSYVKWLRFLQLFLRLLELVASAGLLVLMILVTKVDAVNKWIMRITPGVVTLHCIYAIYHLSSDPGRRPPASSSAYHLFSAVTDVAAAPIYGFCVYMVDKQADSWKTLLADQELMDDFVPAIYYGYIAAGSLLLASFSVSCWLGLMFRKISLLPPDMNPLEDNLTARPRHKKSKSSVTTFSSCETDSRLGTPRQSRRQSILHDAIEPPPAIPFMHTRTGSSTTVGSRGSRQYQRTPMHSSRDSIASRDTKRTSARSTHRESYAEVPLNDLDSSRPPTSSSNRNNPSSRPAKFTETWAPTDSLISRTNQRHREMAAAKTSAQNRSSKTYEALAPRYNDESSDDEFGDENFEILGYDEEDLGGDGKPHPLRSNPTEVERATPPRIKTPFFALGPSLSEVSPNARRVSASRDIADEKPGLSPGKPSSRNRQSSIQPETDFYSRPYGELTSRTPPVMVGSNRKISSGNDFDSKLKSPAYERRNVSGKIVEEGRGGLVGNRISLYESRFGRDE